MLEAIFSNVGRSMPWATLFYKEKSSNQAFVGDPKACRAAIITEFLNCPSDLSKVLASIIVAVSYNFLLQKYFVFKQ